MRVGRSIKSLGIFKYKLFKDLNWESFSNPCDIVELSNELLPNLRYSSVNVYKLWNSENNYWQQLLVILLSEMLILNLFKCISLLNPSKIFKLPSSLEILLWLRSKVKLVKFFIFNIYFINNISYSLQILLFGNYNERSFRNSC